MAKLSIVAAALVAVALIGGGIFLASWNIPAPTHHAETPIEDSKLPQ